MANDFSCEDCDVSFGRSESLSRHVKSVHDGKKTYSCPYCEKQLGRTILIFKPAILCMAGFRYKGCVSGGNLFLTPVKLCDWSNASK